MVQFEFVVVVVGVRAELQFLYLNDVLLLLSFVLLLFLLILPLTVVHGLGNGRLSSRGNENQIKAQFLGSANGSGRGHDLDRSIREDSSDFTNPDCLIDVFADFGPAWRE